MHYISTLCSHIRLAGLANQRTLPMAHSSSPRTKLIGSQGLYYQLTVALQRNNHILVLNYMRK